MNFRKKEEYKSGSISSRELSTNETRDNSASPISAELYDSPFKKQISGFSLTNILNPEIGDMDLPSKRKISLKDILNDDEAKNKYEGNG